MKSITLIYYTDNSLPEYFVSTIQKHLLRVAGDFPIISVSQKPMNFGTNICVGEIGQSHISLFKQILVGAENAKTDIVFLIEHDCLYAPEHFDFIPKEKNTFYYNLNHWFVQWNKNYKLNGMYSYHRRKCLSQCVGFRDNMIDCLKEKIFMLESGAPLRKGQTGACEPGVCDNRVAFMAELARIKDLGKEGKQWKAERFKTRLSNLDIRHGDNFSGQRRGKKRCYWLPYWGDFKKVMLMPTNLWQPEFIKI